MCLKVQQLPRDFAAELERLMAIADKAPAPHTPRPHAQPSHDRIAAPQPKPELALADAARAFDVQRTVTVGPAESPWSRRPDPGRVLDGIRLITTPDVAAKIARGDHRIENVNGRHLAFPSQRLTLLESARPNDEGQTHILDRHVNQSLRDNLNRLRAEPGINVAGGFTDVATAQSVVDRTIAVTQGAIRGYLDDPTRVRYALPTVDMGGVVGTNLTRENAASRHPHMEEATTGKVVLIKDPSFREGYRVLTAYPSTQPPFRAADGHKLNAVPG